MKNLANITVLILAISLASCSAYKTGQTPDDVYFSPGKVLQPKEDVEYQEYQAYNDDQYLKMKVQNNNLWSSIDDYDYWYDSRYAFGLNYYSPAFMYYGYSNIYSPYYSYYYNPCAYYEYSYWGMYNPVYVAAYYKNPTISRSYYTSASNISAYNNKKYNVINTGYRINTPTSGNDQSRFSQYNNNYRNPSTYNTQTNSSSQSSWSNPVRVSSGTYSSNTGGASGGVSNSSRSSSGGGRSGRN
jgi:Beta-propeller domains of methanol dehydrogenase type